MIEDIKVAAKAAEKEAAKAEREAAKAAKAAEREAAKAEREAARAAKAAEKEAERAAKVAEREAAKAAKAAEKEAAKAEREAARKRPEQNGVRLPRPETLAGRIWEEADAISRHKGSPVAISELFASAALEGMNANNVRAEYASWRKFHGVTGRISAHKPEAVAE